MSDQDRTEEFFAAVESIKARRQTGERLIVMPSSSSVIVSHSMKKGTEFAVVSQNINNDIHKTKSKLERLSTCKQVMVVYDGGCIFCGFE